MLGSGGGSVAFAPGLSSAPRTAFPVLAAAVEPLLAMVADEVEAKLNVRPARDLSPLLPDLHVPSQAFKRMVSAGVPLAEAWALTGLDTE